MSSLKRPLSTYSVTSNEKRSTSNNSNETGHDNINSQSNSSIIRSYLSNSEETSELSNVPNQMNNSVKFKKSFTKTTSNITNESIELEDVEGDDDVYNKVTDNKNKKSKVWEYFGEGINSEDNRRVFCMIDGCEYHSAFSGSTTRCIKHLKKKHNIDIKEPELNEQKKCSEDDAESLNYLLVMFIITSGKLFGI